MTEQNTPSAPVEEPTPVADSPKPPDADKRKGKNTGPVLGAIAIVLVIALAPAAITTHINRHSS